MNEVTFECGNEKLFISQKEADRLKQEILKHLKPIKTINLKNSSYGIKHQFEKYLGFYMSNADFKKAMTECGFKHQRHFGSSNWYFNVSQKSLNEFYMLTNLLS